MVNKQNILYISYDGMTDPLGQSQVLPYICGLAREGYSFTLISCEKKDRFTQYQSKIRTICKEYNIDWQPLPFTTFPPILSKLLDKNRIKNLALKLHEKKNFSMVHCRSYIAAEIGMEMKLKFGTKFFFDMRGFWVDERVDGGIWNLKNPIFKFAYKRYKQKEAAYIRNADKIISLTEAAVKEICSWPTYSGSSFTVVPCSADFKLFKPYRQDEISQARRNLNLEKAYPVLSYLGSVGTWYLLEEMLKLFKVVKENYSEAHFLIITPENPETILSKAKLEGLDERDFTIKFATREQVPQLLSVSDIGISFIKTSYSKIASSPTKLGELFAMGIPVITNDKVGDVADIVRNLDAGIVISEFSRSDFERVVEEIPRLLKVDKQGLRKRALSYYDLDRAIMKYIESYKQVLA